MKYLHKIIAKQEYHDHCFHSFLLKTDYIHVKLFLNVHKNGKNCYDKRLLSRYWTIIVLLLMITVNSKNWTISIIVKQNIMVNRQNR